MQPEWLKVEEAAAYLSVARSTLTKWTREGKVKSYSLGNEVGPNRPRRYKRGELDALARPNGESVSAD